MVATSELAGIRLALERIAAVLEGALTPPTSAAQQGCGHPLEARIDFGTTNGVEDFECRACGYRSVRQRD